MTEEIKKLHELIDQKNKKRILATLEQESQIALPEAELEQGGEIDVVEF